MNKCKDKKGFTLMEMLVCVITLIIICLMCTTGMNLATKSYNDSMFEAHSQMVETMLDSAVGDLLRFSSKVSVSGEEIIFTNSTYGMEQGTLTLNDKGYFVLKKSSGKEVLLLASSAYVDGMYIDISTEGGGPWLTYDADTHVFTGSYKIKSKTTTKVKDVNFTFKSVLEG